MRLLKHFFLLAKTFYLKRIFYTKIMISYNLLIVVVIPFFTIILEYYRISF